MSEARARAVHGAASLLATLFWLWGCVGPIGAGGPTPVQGRSHQLIVAVPLVTPAVRSEIASRIARQHDLELVAAFPLESIDVHCIVFEIEDGRDPEVLARKLSAYPGVELVQRNQLFEGLAEPYAEFQHGPRALRADRAHRWVTGRGVRVAVIDTGVDREHPDLAGRITLARNFVEHGERSFSRDAHGTAVAGVIAARADNAQGIYGVAPEAELLVGKACWHAGSDEAARCSSWTLARAIDFSLGANAQVINLSLAGPPDPLLTRLLATAHGRGVIVTAAAGSSARGPAFPASLDSVIAVVASDADETPGTAPWRRAARALAAPGSEILTTAPGARYRFRSGSSLSTAHVTGAVALLLELDPELSPERVATLLAATAQPPGPGVDAGESWLGSVDACAAVRRLSGGGECP